MIKLICSAALLAAATAAFAAPQNGSSANQPQANAPTTSTTAKRSPLKPGDRQCIRDTGSLIPPKKGECLPVAGRSYTKQDIDNTGENTLGPALEKLDPAITTRGYGGH